MSKRHKPITTVYVTTDDSLITSQSVERVYGVGLSKADTKEGRAYGHIYSYADTLTVWKFKRGLRRKEPPEGSLEEIRKNGCLVSRIRYDNNNAVVEDIGPDGVTLLLRPFSRVGPRPGPFRLQAVTRICPKEACLYDDPSTPRYSIDSSHYS